VTLTDNIGYNGTFTGTPVVIASVATPNTMAFRGVARVALGCPPVTGLRVPDVSATQANVIWNAPGGGNYEYSITTSPTPPLSGTSTTSALINVTGLTDATTYYVHVRTNCTIAGSSEWTSVSFVTGCKSPASPLVNISVGGGGLASGKWNKVFGAAGYEYLISTSSTPPSSGTATTDTTFTVPNLNSVTQYYLHVRSDCGSGSFSAWTTKAFTTSCFMPAPNVVVQTKSAGVKWNKIINAVKYEYALTFAPAKPTSGTYTIDTAYAISKVDEGTAYYFHVRSVCSTGAKSEWSTLSFNTQGLQVYPNPVKDVLTIQFNGIINFSSEIMIADAIGRVIARLRLNNSTATINSRGWAPGIYLVRYNDGKNKYSVRIVKQ
jgi:hypothetical protein